MHYYHVNITRSQLICVQHPAPFRYRSPLHAFFRKVRVRELFAKLREPLIHGLATLTVSTVFLGGVYLFLVQLAEHGW